MSNGPPLPMMITLALVLAGVVAVIIASTIAERKKRRQIEQALDAAGIEILHAPGRKNPAAAARAFERLGPLRNLSRGAKAVQFAGLAREGGREICIVQHAYTVSTGKSQHTVYHAMAAVPCPPAWPELRLKPEHFLHKLADWIGHTDIKVESETFNQRWRVTGRDPEFATVLLTPQIQARLTDWPKGYWAAIGQGAIVVALNARLKPAQIPTIIGLAAELAEMIPPELDVWGIDEVRAGN